MRAISIDIILCVSVSYFPPENRYHRTHTHAHAHTHTNTRSHTLYKHKHNIYTKNNNTFIHTVIKTVSVWKKENGCI